MDPVFCPLKELEIDGRLQYVKLPRMWSPFSIPKLADKPQNPIITMLESKRKPQHPIRPPAKIGISAEKSFTQEETEPALSIWERLILDPDLGEYQNRLLSWDTLRDSINEPSASSSFLTEQSPRIVSAARHRALPRFVQSNERLVYLSPGELLKCLSLTLAGDSSPVHTWDVSSEKFRTSESEEREVRIVLDGMDEVVCESYLDKFVQLGTLMRRLSLQAVQLQRQQRNAIPTTSGFAHALSCILSWVRTEVSEVLARIQQAGADRICDVWKSLQGYGHIMNVLGDLCCRGLHQYPSTYPPLPVSPCALLSHIYSELANNIDRGAPTSVTAVLSFILTVTSRPYFTSLGESIGLEGLEKILEDVRLKARKKLDEAESAFLQDEDDDSDIDGDDVAEDFPVFFSKELKEAVRRARRSINILASPEVDDGHPIHLKRFKKLEWVWTEEKINLLADPSYPSDVTCLSLLKEPEGKKDMPDQELKQKYKPGLARFATFDMEPGTLVSYGPASSTNSLEQRQLSSFIMCYPPRLPPYASTLPLLSERILTPLVAQASVLGRAALRIFLTPKTPLQFRAHLALLRAYLLLAAPAFKARLSAALFSDALAEDDDAQENPMGVTIRTRDRNTNWRAMRRRTDPLEMRSERARAQHWPVGLAFGLTDRGQWPPGGSDLAFYLRRVIMDSLEDVRATENTSGRGTSDELGDNEFWSEGESRIGFALRELPTGKGRDKWMDPTLIEALDFLYMDYKPPRPLRSLITTDIISKYKRIFAFLLRLMRVEHATRVLYRLTRPPNIAIFVDQPAVLNTINHFRFSAESFVSALSAYAADTAIRGNLDAFLARVKAAEVDFADPDSQIEATGLSVKGDFADVYSLMKRHSRVLDDVLAACLLRGTQQAVAQLLHNVLEGILEFAIIVGSVHKGSVQESAAEERIRSLYRDYQRKIARLIKTLRKVCTRESKGFTIGVSDREKRLPAAPGGQEALADLLVRLSSRDVGVQS